MALNEYEVGATVKLTALFKDADGALVTPTTVTLVVTDSEGTATSVAGIVNDSPGSYYGYFTTAEEGDHTYKWTGDSPGIGWTDVQSGFFIAVDYTQTDLDYLIPFVRFHMGDLENRRYTTSTLRMALVYALKLLQRRWNSKYLIDATNTTVTRNADMLYYFRQTAPPTIESRDEAAFVLQAAILLKSGIMQDSSWQVAAWRDDEIQVSNIQADRSRHRGLDRDMEMLDLFFKRRLYAGRRQSLPGFKYPPNWYEG